MVSLNGIYCNRFLTEFDPKSACMCLSGLNFGCGVGDVFNNAELVVFQESKRQGYLIAFSFLAGMIKAKDWECNEIMN